MTDKFKKGDLVYFRLRVDGLMETWRGRIVGKDDDIYVVRYQGINTFFIPATFTISEEFIISTI